MIETIYARVVAIPVNFPEELDIHYQTLDRATGENVAVFGSPRRFTWEEVKRKFSIGEARALACEGQLRQGVTALVAEAREWEGDWNLKTTFESYHVRRSH
jgi:hypothetical protein